MRRRGSNTVVGPISFNYEIDVYGDWETIHERYPDMDPLNRHELQITDLPARRTVVGVTDGEGTRAYPIRRVRWNDPVHDVVGSVPVLVTLADHDTLVAYDRRVNGQTLTFEEGQKETYLVGGGSRWNRLAGGAIDGPYEGTRLQPAPGLGPLGCLATLPSRFGSLPFGLTAFGPLKSPL